MNSLDLSKYDAYCASYMDDDKRRKDSSNWIGESRSTGCSRAFVKGLEEPPCPAQGLSAHRTPPLHNSRTLSALENLV